MTTYDSLAALGRKLFRFRLLVGLCVALGGLEWISPTPLLASKYLVVHGCAVLVILAGLALRAWGAGSAGGHTRSERIEAAQLVTGGPFAYVRNPIYAGSICLGLGMCMLIGDPVAFGFAAIAFAILYLAIIPAEEGFLLERFGSEYSAYRQAVPRIIPRVKPWPGRTERPFQWRAARGEFWIVLVLALIYSALLFEEYLDALKLS